MFKKVNGSESNGTHFQGYLRASVSDLYVAFGEPSYHSDDKDDKTQYEWVLKFDDKIVATIYDYKEYRQFDTADVLQFHIGGFDKRAVNEVKYAFNGRI